MTAPDTRLLLSLDHLADLLARVGHPRAAEVADSVDLFAESPARVRHRLDAIVGKADAPARCRPSARAQRP